VSDSDTAADADARANSVADALAVASTAHDYCADL
jgi:hypothetical protein